LRGSSAAKACLDDFCRKYATLIATLKRSVHMTLNGDEHQGLTDDDRFILLRYDHFRAAAGYIAAAFASVATVRRVALFGSVASSPRTESAGRRTRRTHIHEPKDVDLAVWIDNTTDLDRLRVLRSRAVNQLWNEREIGVAHHQVDVFLLDSAGHYLGRLCCFNQCPKHKPECRAVGCGKLPFLRQHDGFVFHRAKS
jgi:predicted nucleotidyltransferase